MKKKLALLFVLIMVLSSMPVMAAAVSADPAGVASDVTTQAAKNGWVKSGTGYMFYVNGKAYKKGIYWIGGKRYGFDANGKLCRGWFKLNGHSYFASNVNGAKGYGEVLTGYRKIGNKFFFTLCFVGTGFPLLRCYDFSIRCSIYFQNRSFYP